jgi:hypothetical protein
MTCSNSAYFFLVEIPKGKYSGQKLIKLVRIKAPARIKRIMATVPDRMFVKYRIIIAIAIRILSALSSVPMLFFIIF